MHLNGENCSKSVNGENLQLMTKLTEENEKDLTPGVSAPRPGLKHYFQTSSSLKHLDQ